MALDHPVAGLELSRPNTVPIHAEVLQLVAQIPEHRVVNANSSSIRAFSASKAWDSTFFAVHMYTTSSSTANPPEYMGIMSWLDIKTWCNMFKTSSRYVFVKHVPV